MSSEIIVLGTCVVDLMSYAQRFPRPGETLIGDDFKKGFGGKAANQCVMSSYLGASAALIAKIGNDSFGREYLENLKINNINSECVFVTDRGITSTANICVTSKGENTIIYTPGAANLLTPEEIATAEKLLFTSGSAKLLVCTFECPPNTLVEALKKAKSRNIKTIVNAAPVSEVSLEQISSLTDFLCMNEVEITHFTKIQVDSVKSGKEAAVSLLKMKFGTVIITLGKDGVVYCSQTETVPVHIEADAVVAVDSTGAGDAFVGSLAYFVAKLPHLSIKEAITRASKIASISVQSHGTQSSYPKKLNLDPLLFL